MALGPSPPDPVGGEIAGHYFQAKVPERREGDLCLGVGALSLPPQRPVVMWDYRQLEVLLMSHRWHESERASTTIENAVICGKSSGAEGGG